MMTAVAALFFITIFVLSVVTVTGKLVFLATGKLGYLVFLSNLFYDFFEKKFSLCRKVMDIALPVLIAGGWAIVAGMWAGFMYAILYTGLWLVAFHIESSILRGGSGKQDAKYSERGLPLPNPCLILHLEGPVLVRSSVYRLGGWPVGHRQAFVAVVINPTSIWPQFPIEATVTVENTNVNVKSAFESQQKAPAPGEFIRLPFTIEASDVTDKPVRILLTVRLGSYKIRETLEIVSIFPLNGLRIDEVRINRWKGGALAGFAWRGDMDLYDPSTLQSVEGLEPVLGLSRRFRVPSSMYLSGRLSLVKEEHRKFCEKLGVDRNTEGIDGFIDFMKKEVTLAPVLDFPFDTGRRYAMELGNHMYLHYGTHSAMDEGNNWKMSAKMGEGKYFWQSKEAGSFAEQRDNARYNAKLIKDTLGFGVRSWAAPSRAYDRFTPKAIEAAGMTVGSNTDATTFDDVLRLRPPHHPIECEKLVELTKKYPGDPDNIYRVAMLKYWIGLAVRRRLAFVFMVHHHALQYKGSGCIKMTEEILRHVIEDHRGNFYIGTVCGLGEYWDRVLCPKHRWTSAEVKEAGVVEVINRGDEPLNGIPIEVSFTNNRKLLLLVSIPPQGVTKIEFKTSISTSNLHNPQNAEYLN